ncbi:hypothetical protein ZWY2020_025438 [Hordeum vulgare]|nr:hypothetical protein ZWY2020_025438 [Hordeum vulgare]
MASCSSEDSQTHQCPSGVSSEEAYEGPTGSDSPETGDGIPCTAEEHGVDLILRDAWDASIINKAKLAALRSSGAICEHLVLRVPLPSEPWPAPVEGEAVVFVDHLRCGLGLPFSPFFRSVLEFYKVESANLPPNSILMLSTFAHLCEAFVGVMPDLDTFRHFFLLRTSDGKRVEVAGCSSFRMRPNRQAKYLPASFKSSFKPWRKLWLYARKGADDPGFRGRRAVSRRDWSAEPEPSKKLKALLNRILELKESGLTASHVVGDFIRRRILPLQRRARPSWESHDGSPRMAFAFQFNYLLAEKWAHGMEATAPSPLTDLEEHQIQEIISKTTRLLIV